MARYVFNGVVVEPRSCLSVEISDGDSYTRATGALGECDRSQSRPLEIFLNLEVYHSG